MTDLDRHTARTIINQLGSSGQPPEFGVRYFTVGLDPYLSTINKEYLSTFIREGGSAFKLVVGVYGGGKTHFLYSVRDIGWSEDFAVSYVSLKSSGECPFDRLDLVYKAIARGLLPPIADTETKPADLKGIQGFLESWYSRCLRHYREQGRSGADAKEAIKNDIYSISVARVQSISFRNAIVGALKAILDGQEQTLSEIIQWILGENPRMQRLKRLGISQKIDKTTAFSMIRSLSQMIRQLGYSGLLVLLDEAEQVPSLGKRQREQLLSNLRELIDECGHSTFEGTMVFYAVPDRNFLDGRTQVYEALRQRLATTFDYLNPTGVTIELDRTIPEPTDFLVKVGGKIAPIYEKAHGQSLDSSKVGPFTKSLAEYAVEQRFMDTGYKRLFVQRFVHGLDIIRLKNCIPDLNELEQKTL
jgi:hypothetical protein